MYSLRSQSTAFSYSITPLCSHPVQLRNPLVIIPEYEVKLQQYQYLEAEKKQLFEEFHKIVYELHQKTGLRNLVLEKKLETIQESLETKDAQINQILATARIDPQAMGMIRSTLEEVEQLKNDAIREIQTELKKIREAHSNMVKTYEGKLSEFGIPVEELGFDPLVPANIWGYNLGKQVG